MEDTIAGLPLDGVATIQWMCMGGGDPESGSIQQCASFEALYEGEVIGIVKIIPGANKYEAQCGNMQFGLTEGHHEAQRWVERVFYTTTTRLQSIKECRNIVADNPNLPQLALMRHYDNVFGLYSNKPL